MWSCSKLHEYAGSRNCQRMVSNFERQPPPALMHRLGTAAKSIWLSRHICHAPLTPGDRTGLRWRGCHNSAASFGSVRRRVPPKSLAGREGSIFKPPAQSSRRICHHPGHRDVDRSETACPSPPGCSIFAASCTRSYAGYVPVLAVYSVVKDQRRKNPLLDNHDKKRAVCPCL